MTSETSSQAHWITDPAELDRWLLKHAGEPLALDTEFERVSTFYPIPGLVQVGAGDGLYLIDPDVAAASNQFRQVLADPDTPKLLYAMSEDLELFRHWLDIRPAGVLDLQIGVALAGAGFSVGYARIVETLFNQSLDKSATRSDWLKRPLSAAQQAYALEDIRYLAPLYDWVCEQLQAKGLMKALAEESTRFADDLYQQDDPASHYLRLRGGWALDERRQQVLQRITQWREQECRDRDRPRNRVLPDAVLIALAERLPRNKAELQSVKDMPAVVVRRFGDRLLSLIQGNGESIDAFTRIRPPLTREQQKQYKQLKQVFHTIAEANAVPIELLAPRKRLENLVQSRQIQAGPLQEGWRAALIAPVSDKIEAILNP
ncbi:MAG: HRDC domain-containing protein [Marinobacter sp.]|uniref:ribonuclease D n=1 Tax=Marinobacter sp. TaxID=50741 RepID=UPI00299DB9DD|nr:HRDC domain-containing protein [Marinobacter sp.]MDX1754903.1 HRDC domain-containing protein [Marinobacter sp.]